MAVLASAIRAGALPSWEKIYLRSNPGSRARCWRWGNRRLPFFLRQRYLTWETPLSANATS